MFIKKLKKKDLINLGTSLTIGSFAICSFTGLVMYFDLLNAGMKETHEILGIVFCIAVIIHLAGHIKSVPKYFKRSSSLSLILAMFALGFANIYLTYDDLPSGKVAFEKISKTKIKYLIPVLGKSEQELRTSLKEHNVDKLDLNKSFSDLAKENKLELHDLLEPFLK